MPEMPDIHDVTRDVDALLGSVATAQPRIADEALRGFVGRLSGRLREVRGQLVAQIPPHVANARAEAADARRWADAIKAGVPEIRLRAEEAERARQAAPATPPPAPVDPGLASTLRDELLARYGPPSATPRGIAGGNPRRPGWGH